MIKRRPMAFAVVFPLLFLGGTVSRAQDPAQAEQQVAGSSVFRTYCEVCHGRAGKGDGPLAESMRVRPPDLTLIAKKNGGTFPRERVVRMVDGRNPVKGHGGPDMPVWGDAFKNVGAGNSEAAVQAKIKSVVHYLETIQAR
jgi:mono/diheme cytochrome c family protein